MLSTSCISVVTSLLPFLYVPFMQASVLRLLMVWANGKLLSFALQLSFLLLIFSLLFSHSHVFSMRRNIPLIDFICAYVDCQPMVWKLLQENFGENNFFRPYRNFILNSKGRLYSFRAQFAGGYNLFYLTPDFMVLI